MSNHLPAYMHDEKVVISKNRTWITFLWRHASDEVLIQIDNIRLQPGVRGGTKIRTAKTTTKAFARNVWESYMIHHGYTRVK